MTLFHTIYRVKFKIKDEIGDLLEITLSCYENVFAYDGLLAVVYSCDFDPYDKSSDFQPM